MSNSDTDLPKALSVEEASDIAQTVSSGMREAVIADSEFFDTLLTAVFARGHVLLEDVPGTGKTLAAHCLAQALGLSYNRIQFTPDLLPTDITGTYVYNEAESEFEFKRGPLFANVILADELNRAPPKTQAALLEAMEEEQVTVEGTTHDLPDPLLVIATQNPVEQEGTFELPEAQRDRFAIKTSMGYPSYEGEQELLDNRNNRRTQMPSVEPVTTKKEVKRAQQTPEEIHIEEDLRDYMIDIARGTRTHSDVEIGVSPRGTQRLFETARARAVINGRSYLAPDDVKTVAPDVCRHRLVLTAEASVGNVSKTAIVNDVLSSTSVPEATASR